MYTHPGMVSLGLACAYTYMYIHAILWCVIMDTPGKVSVHLIPTGNGKKITTEERWTHGGIQTPKIGIKKTRPILLRLSTRQRSDVLQRALRRRYPNVTLNKKQQNFNV